MSVKITIDPRFIFNYASYYIYGLIEKFGENNISFKPIQNLTVESYEDYRKGFAFTISSNGIIKNIFVDTNDSNKIHKRYYKWSDIYAKVNTTKEDSETKSKLIEIGPSFAIRVWNPLKTIYTGLRNYQKCGVGFRIPFKRYILDYLYTIIRRLPYKYYHHECREDLDYCFTLSTLWYDEGTYNSTNRLRGIFARKCKNTYPQFEGGFFYINSPGVLKEFQKYSEYLEEYKDMLIKKRISMKEYMARTVKSAIVFNTPSVLGCHGWKLGEYLAMGKAIISTPLNNIMPGSFVSGKHFISASNDNEIEVTVDELRKNPKKILELKKNATEYFNQYLSPTAVIERILNRVTE